ncbi:PREDICTED: magnesium transporter MRS2-11, chloroplastic isoform X3 [Nicotiana attenuata]|uniref:magnesium transporter MRS2-11, chloroplastic isoform X3 n=1 Tax=Nicotiana attenuata TaxID=49451 RepID=UPI000905862F|nr:PREDICTED: magnesium transporter MRS2-11, chloroplastic isoform X3 [Nicotiana attenuata]
MAATAPHVLQLPVRSPELRVLIAGYAIFRSRLELPYLRKNHAPLHVKARKVKVECVAKSTEEETELEALVKDGDDDDDDVAISREYSNGSAISQKTVSNSTSSPDSLSLGIREPVYEVVEVKSSGTVAKRNINRRHLLKSSGLRPRDIRSVDPSLWLTNSMPALLVREHAILLNLGSLRAIIMQEQVLIFNYNRKGGKAFIDALLPRLNPKNTNGGPSMPFVLEVVEAALHSRIQRLEHRLWDLEPRVSMEHRIVYNLCRSFLRETALIYGVSFKVHACLAVRVQALLEVLPNRLTADILEELRISKQKLVELGSRAGALKQMLLDILEDTHEIRRICIMGRNCVLKKENDEMECSVPLEKEVAEEEEEEIEMLLENYLQRCESCHGQAERLLDSAKEMEDSIAVNLRANWYRRCFPSSEKTLLCNFPGLKCFETFLML